MKPLFPLLLLIATGACSNEQTSTDALQDRHGQQTASASVALLGRVSDHAHILSPSDEEALTERLETLEQKTQHQMVVVSVNSLEGEDIARFTLKLANAWGIGRAKYDDGVVLLVAPNERKVRIEVGYGLEETLTDEVCKRILDEHMLPHFRQQDFMGGIEAGTDALIEALSPAPPTI